MEDFFEFARARHDIYLARQEGKPWPWTEDPALRDYFFTNIYRELDGTTVWFKENFRDEMAADPGVLFGTVAFRWFNREESGAALIGNGEEPNLLINWDRAEARKRLLESGEPYTGAAYIIRTHEGSSKLDGVLDNITKFWETSGHMEHAENLMAIPNKNLRDTWEWLKRADLIGDFMAYEVVCDLLYTELLGDANDRMTWANPGPGAVRGLNRMHGRELKKQHPKDACIAEIKEILDVAPDHGWTDWDMRTVEHTLCEFDKYVRAGVDPTRMKRRYWPDGQRKRSAASGGEARRTRKKAQSQLTYFVVNGRLGKQDPNRDLTLSSGAIELIDDLIPEGDDDVVTKSILTLKSGLMIYCLQTRDEVLEMSGGKINQHTTAEEADTPGDE